MVPGPRPQEDEAVGEWIVCQSPRRLYTAVNEALSNAEMAEFLRRFFRRVHAPRRCFKLSRTDPRLLYESFVTAVEFDERHAELLRRAWEHFVKAIYPTPPNGRKFVYVGKNPSLPKQIPLLPSPKLEPHRLMIPNPARCR